MNCRVCGKPCDLREVVKNCRMEEATVGLRTHPWRVRTGDLPIYECAFCGHIQAEYLLPETFHEEYHGTGVVPSQYYGSLNVQEKQCQALRRLAPSDAKVFEIGCGAGRTLGTLRKHFRYCLGIEPSQSECQNARRSFAGEEGVEIREGRFEQALALPEDFDAFCAFQVLEHIDQTQAALEYAFRCLVQGGVGLINVPNGEQIFENALFHQICFEHVNYFTPHSLSLACRAAGFALLSVEADYDTMELNAYVRKPGEKRSVNRAREHLKNELYRYLRKEARIGIYGVGAKAMYYAPLLQGYTVERVFDSDAGKHGLYVSGLDKPITRYSPDAAEELDVMLIFASSYNREIIEFLRASGFSKRIVYFDNTDVRCV